MSKDYDAIKNITESFLEKMGINGTIEIVSGVDYPVFTITTNEAGILIGENGQNLFSFSHILKKMAYKIFKDKNKEMPPFSLDVNGYYSKKINNLKEVAKMNAQRVRFFKKEVEFEPMNSFERRIIHTVLSEYPDIKTESMGDGENRKVVIKPV